MGTIAMRLFAQGNAATEVDEDARVREVVRAASEQSLREAVETQQSALTATFKRLAGTSFGEA